MDFGLALTKAQHRVTYSNLSATMGTPDYMAPEQIDGQRGDQRTDIYALGIILFEMLVGHPPFTGDSNMVIMSQHMSSLPPRLDKLDPTISPQLAAIVAKCLQKNPINRFTDMDELLDAINNPDNMDIRILEQVDQNRSTGPSLAIIQTLRAIGIALAIIIALIAIAILLQSLRH